MVIDIKKLKKQLTVVIRTDKGERKNIVIEENFMISVYVFIIQIFIMLKKIIWCVNEHPEFTITVLKGVNMRKM